MTTKSILPLLILAFASTAQGQVDMNTILQKAQAQQATKGGGAGSVKVEEDKGDFVPNKFIGSFQMEIHSYRNGAEEKDSPMRMSMYSSEEMSLFHPQGDGKSKEEMKVLIDLKGKWQYSLMTDKKGARTAMKMRKMKVTVADDGSSDKDAQAKVERTDETRTIDGHLCHKWIGSSEDGSWTAWVAEGLETPFMDMARSMGAGMNTQQFDLPKGMGGFPLESEFIDANGKDRIVSYTRDLKIGSVDPAVFSLEGYEVMELPTMNFGGH